MYHDVSTFFCISLIGIQMLKHRNTHYILYIIDYINKKTLQIY